jgi:hypothetical protein
MVTLHFGSRQSSILDPIGFGHGFPSFRPLITKIACSGLLRFADAAQGFLIGFPKA